MTKELNNIIDTNLLGHLQFQHKELNVNSEQMEFYYRDVIESIQGLYGELIN